MTRKLHIISGLILFAFVTVHLTNLALGFFSLKVADDARLVLMAPFTNPVGGMLLITAMLLHMVLGLQSLYLRNTLRMSRHDTVQYISAFLIPPLLIPHVWGIIATRELLGLLPSYLDLFRLFWVHSPLDGLRQVLLVVVLWIHGCIGLFTWLKLKHWWSRYAPFAYPLAVVIPVIALLGFVAGGKHIVSMTNTASSELPYSSAETTGGFESSHGKPDHPPPDNFGEILAAEESQEAVGFIGRTGRQLTIGYLIILMLVLIARQLRVWNKNEFVEVRYADGRVIVGETGPTLLELASMNDIPHANLCRGRGRCGTCRVAILASDTALSPPSNTELETLARLGGGTDDVRLACQVSPGSGVIHVKRLLPPNIQLMNLSTSDDGLEEPQSAQPDTSVEGSAT